MSQAVAEKTPALSPGQLRWACRRGMLELDLVFECFLQHGFAKLSPQQQFDFEQLLEYPDQELFDFFLKGEQPDVPEIAQLVEQIRVIVRSNP
jgi:antitoxin CptB